ncbi:MAG: colicin production protein [Clostridia bacterium]|nr:colicin production protein [Clostridia bacterium]
MNWMDLCIIIILALGTITGIRRGFVASITSVACVIVSIIAAKTYYTTVSVFLLTNTALKDTIIKFMVDKKVLQGFNGFMPGNTMTAFYSDYFTQDIHTFISIAVINLISIVGIYLVVRFALAIVEGYVKSASEMPGLNEINRLGGGAIGFVKTVLVLLLVFAAIIPMSNMLPWEGFRDAVEGSLLAKYFYSYNFILGWIWNSALELIKK